MSLIYYLSSLPASSTGPDTFSFKIVTKVSHFIIFGMLSVLYLFSFKWKKSLRDTSIGIFILSLLLAVIYAAMDEYHQSFSNGRHARFADVILDSSGAIAFLMIFYKIRLKKLNFLSQKFGTEIK